ncbi:MAG: hypothetical protein LBP24_01080 [Coriobacteriales bacterium]|jgi:uncharacterized Zn finger protein (UPF0148 family)|nr:hypothetical protein [Coriobacteriales bacterium]
MTAIEVSCSQCGSGEYRLVDARTGEVTCAYCRNQWIVPELAQKSETEKFLEQQAKQPRIIQDNSTETDRQIMNVVASAASGRLFSGLSRVLKTLIVTAAIIAGTVIALIVGLIIYRVLT